MYGSTDMENKFKDIAAIVQAVVGIVLLIAAIGFFGT
jgi:hypothetical protein